MRPRSMIWFDWLYWIGWLMALGVGLSNVPAILNQVAHDSEFDQTGKAIYVGLILVEMMAGDIVGLPLWYLASRRANKSARWIFLVIMALLLFFRFQGMIALTRAGALSPIAAGVHCVIGIVDVAALVMLFRPDSRAWFANGGKEVDLQAFD